VNAVTHLTSMREPACFVRALIARSEPSAKSRAVRRSLPSVVITDLFQPRIWLPLRIPSGQNGRAISNQDSAGESLTSIANVPYLEVKVVFELRRMVGVATGGCLTLSTQALRRWGCQDAASPCFRLNPGQVLWPSYSRHLGRDAFR
jgi:hypothetical protein